MVNEVDTDARPARTRVTVAVVVGLAVAIISGTLGSWIYAPALGWICGAIVYLVWTCTPTTTTA